MNLWEKKITLTLLFIILTLLNGCGGSSNSNKDPEISENTLEEEFPTETESTNKFAIQQGKIINNSGSGVKGAIISIGRNSTSTDNNGNYTLRYLDENKKALVHIKPQNGPTQSTTISINKYSKDTTQLSTNYLEYIVDTYEYIWESESNEGITEKEGSHIVIPAFGYSTLSGSSYNGTVTHKLSFEDIWTDKSRDTFPGEYKGINSNGVTVPFVSYGLMSIDLADNTGNRIGLSHDMSIIFYSAKNRNDDTIPLWHYKPNQGIWKEESIAYRQEDGTYKGDISYTGTWSLSKPVEKELGVYRGRIVYLDESPVKDARVSLRGNNWITKDLNTDSQGYFKINIIPGEEFRLKAYNYKFKYSASYPNVFPAINPGEVIENRI